MTDRQALKPGRITLVPVAGQANTYDISMADEPTNEGTPLSKATFLQDDTAQLLGLTSSDPTVNEALFKLAMSSADGYPVAITLLDFLGNPLSGITISGVKTFSGGTVVTNSNGYALAFSATASTTLSVTSPYVDLQSTSRTVTLSDSSLITVSLVLPAQTYSSRTFAASATIQFSDAVSVASVTAVGGGGGGGGGSSFSSESSSGGGGGGGGGYVTSFSGINPVRHIAYAITIGAGGYAGTGAAATENASGTSGGTGGTSSALGITALGGNGGGGGQTGSTAIGGTGNGAGGNGGQAFPVVAAGAGVAGTGVYGGGGGGGGYNSSYRGLGGSPYGGAGGYATTNGTGGTGYGGGGGGGATGANTNSAASGRAGGAGYQGVVIISWGYKS